MLRAPSRVTRRPSSLDGEVRVGASSGSAPPLWMSIAYPIAFGAVGALVFGLTGSKGLALAGGVGGVFFGYTFVREGYSA